MNSFNQNENILETYSNYISSDSSEPRDSTSSEATTISFVQQNTNKDKLPLKKTPIQSDKKRFNITETYSKQTLKSRLTICQFIMFILNFFAILTFILLIIFLTKSKNSTSGIFTKIKKKNYFYS
jgi:hypothetical protein